MKHLLLLLTLYTVQIGLAAAAYAHGKEPHAGDADAIGEAGKAEQVSRTVNVEMSDDMRFKPSSIAVKQGETIRFIIHNAGQLKHEFVLGTTKSLREHNEFMKKFPEMEHADPNMVTVAPGKTDEVVWRFTRSGEVDFACLQPGHYDAGMKGAITVAAAKGTTTTTTSVPVDVPADQKSDPARAGANNEGTAGHADTQASSTSPMTDGEVRKIDAENQKITLKHGEMKSFDMPPMTMVFRVTDPAILTTVKTGDKVRFAAEKQGASLVVTRIEVVQ